MSNKRQMAAARKASRKARLEPRHEDRPGVDDLIVRDTEKGVGEPAACECDGAPHNRFADAVVGRGGRPV